MTYDGGRHENCPHCNAPRPQTEPSPSREPVASIVAAFTLNERRELADEGVTRLYADNVPYYVSSNDGCGIESDVAEDATSISESDGLMSDVHEEPRVIDSNDDIPLGVSIPIALLLYFAFVLLMCMISRG
jgi:hypothetical protein